MTLTRVRRLLIGGGLIYTSIAPSLSAQAPARSVGLGFGVDTTEADVGPIVRLVRAYLAAPGAARAGGLWSTRDSRDHTQDDLAARYALQGLPTTIVGILPVDDGDSEYVVKLLHARTDSATGVILPMALQRLYAVRARANPFGWQLAAALPRLTHAWPMHAAGRITFHYAPGQHIDAGRAGEAARFVDSVAALLGVRPPARIHYYVTPSPDTYFRALGLDFFVLPSGRHEASAGNALPDVGVLLAGDPVQGELYRHELVHVALAGRIRSGLINEGFAVWLGGSRRQSPPQLYRVLAAFQREHPDITFATLIRDKLSVPHDPVASADAWYATGALACQFVYRRGGIAGLRQLADAPSDVGATQHLLSRLLGLDDDPSALDRWWRAAAAVF